MCACMCVCVVVCVTTCVQMLMIYSLLLSFHRLETCDPLLHVLTTGIKESSCLPQIVSHIFCILIAGQDKQGVSWFRRLSLQPPSKDLIIFPPHHCLFFFTRNLFIQTLSGVWSLGIAATTPRSASLIQ